MNPKDFSKPKTKTISATEFKKRFSKYLKVAVFRNELGEVFEIYSNDISVWFAGDETDWGVMPLFNNKFDIWSRDELKQLGEALTRLHDE